VYANLRNGVFAQLFPPLFSILDSTLLLALLGLDHCVTLLLGVEQVVRQLAVACGVSGDQRNGIKQTVQCGGLRDGA
jgi:hypothetical protein